MELEPRDRVDEFAVSIDKIRDPKRAIAQKDCHFASLAQAQELPLNRRQRETPMFVGRIAARATRRCRRAIGTLLGLGRRGGLFLLPLLFYAHCGPNLRLTRIRSLKGLLKDS